MAARNDFLIRFLKITLVLVENVTGNQRLVLMIVYFTRRSMSFQTEVSNAENIHAGIWGLLYVVR